MTVSESWMLNSCYHMCKEILERLKRLEGETDEREKTETQKQIDSICECRNNV